MAQKGSIIIVILKVFFLSTLLLACARSHQEGILFSSPAPTTAKITRTAPEVTALPPPTSTSTRRPLLTNTLYPTNTKTNDVTEICSPLENISIPDLPDHVNNPFNPPRLSVDDHHMGVDFAVQEFGMALSGRPVHSVLQGTVVMILDDRFPYGNAVMIETPIDTLSDELLRQLLLPTPSPTIEPHPALNCPPISNAPVFDSDNRSIYILYAHLAEKPILQIDESVDCGEEVGMVGESGNALNPHLHLEVRTGPSWARLGSMSHYSTSASPEEMNAYCTWRVRERFQLLDPMQLFSNPVAGSN